MYKTRMILEVEVSHHGTTDPRSAIHMVTGALTFPAVDYVMVREAKTNYRLHQDPSEEFTSVLP